MRMGTPPKPRNDPAALEAGSSHGLVAPRGAEWGGNARCPMWFQPLENKMTLTEIASWQATIIVALILTNAATLAIAMVAVSLLRQAGLPIWATQLLRITRA